MNKPHRVPPLAVHRASRACGQCDHELDVGAVQATYPQGQGLHLVDGEGLVHGGRPGCGLKEGVDGVDLSLTGGYRLLGSMRGDS